MFHYHYFLTPLCKYVKYPDSTRFIVFQKNPTKFSLSRMKLYWKLLDYLFKSSGEWTSKLILSIIYIHFRFCVILYIFYPYSLLTLMKFTLIMLRDLLPKLLHHVIDEVQSQTSINYVVRYKLRSENVNRFYLIWNIWLSFCLKLSPFDKTGAVMDFQWCQKRLDNEPFRVIRKFQIEGTMITYYCYTMYYYNIDASAHAHAFACAFIHLSPHYCEKTESRSIIFQI